MLFAKILVDFWADIFLKILVGKFAYNLADIFTDMLIDIFIGILSEGVREGLSASLNE